MCCEPLKAYELCKVTFVCERAVQVYQCLLRLLKPARVYTDVQMHGNMKLVQYFQLMQHCVLSRAEKLMVRVGPGARPVDRDSGLMVQTEVLHSHSIRSAGFDSAFFFKWP